MSKQKKEKGKTKKVLKKKFSIQDRVRFWWQERSVLLRFLGLFILLMGGFYLLYFSAFNVTHIHPSIVGAQAYIGASLIGLFEPSVHTIGSIIQGNNFSMNVSGGCDGLEVTALFVAAILAFPSTWKEKGKGLGVGLVILTVLNILRFPVLYWAGTRVSAEFFEFLHVQGGFILFISISILIWAIWIIRIVNERNLQTNQESH